MRLDPTVRATYSGTFSYQGQSQDFTIALTSRQRLLIDVNGLGEDVEMHAYNAPNGEVALTTNNGVVSVDGSANAALRPTRLKLVCLADLIAQDRTFDWTLRLTKVTKKKLFGLGVAPAPPTGGGGDPDPTPTPSPTARPTPIYYYSPALGTTNFTLQGVLHASDTGTGGAAGPDSSEQAIVQVKLRKGQQLAVAGGSVGVTGAPGLSQASDPRILCRILRPHLLAEEDTLLNVAAPLGETVSLNELGGGPDPGTIPNPGFVAPASATYTVCITLQTGDFQGTQTGCYCIEFCTTPTLPTSIICVCPDHRVGGGTGGGEESGDGGAGTSVDLFTGYGSVEPSSGLSIYNPSGPDVGWGVQYSSAQASALSGSAGLPIGWTHPYDYKLKAQMTDGTSSAWPVLSFVAPDGTTDQWSPRQTPLGNSWQLTTDANGQALFDVPADADYFVTATPSLSGHGFTWITMTRRDGSVWTFRTSATDDAQALLYSITAATATAAAPQTLLFHWAWDDADDYRLVSVWNQGAGAEANRQLLALTYSGNDSDGYLLSGAWDVYGRHLAYTGGTMNGTSLTGGSGDVPGAGLVQHLFARRDGHGHRVHLPQHGRHPRDCQCERAPSQQRGPKRHDFVWLQQPGAVGERDGRGGQHNPLHLSRRRHD